MLPTSNGFPVKVLLRYNSVDTPMVALMYSIHHHENEMPQATCYIIDTECWVTIDLAYVTPVLENTKIKEKKVLVE